MNAKPYKERGSLEACIDLVWNEHCEKDRTLAAAVIEILKADYDADEIAGDGESNLILSLPVGTLAEAKKAYADAKKAARKAA